MSNKRKIGDDFEILLESLLKVKRTPNSGAMFKDGDLRSPGFIFEAKNRESKSGYSIPKKELDKLKKQALDRFIDWIYIQKTKDGAIVSMDLQVFKMLWDKYNEKDN